MGKALREMRRKRTHQRLDEENIQLRNQLGGIQTALRNLHATMLRFAVGGNWAQQGYRRLWPWRKKSDMVPVYTWVGAGNPEKAADDVMVECFGWKYKERAQAAFMEARKAQEEKDANPESLVRNHASPHHDGRGE